MGFRRYVIVGEGAAGTTAAVHLRQLDPEALITVVSDEPARPYYRAALTNYLLGELKAEQLWAGPDDHHQRHKLRRVIDQAYEVELGFRRLKLAGGEDLEYDALLLATGARARRASFKGAQLDGVLVLRDMSDAQQSLHRLSGKNRAQRAAVLGGGPLALEWAHAIHQHGAKVTLFLRGTQFLPGVLDAVSSDLLVARLAHGGIEVRLAEEVSEALGDGENHLLGVQTKRAGDQLPCDMLAVAIGIEPRAELARNGPFQLSPSGALEVNEQLRTNVAAVYAAGDVASVRGRTLGLWAPAQEQAQIAAANMVIEAGGTPALESPTCYRPGAHYMATRLYDLDFASVGSVDSPSIDESHVDFPQGTGRISYRKLFFSQGRLIGALMLGEAGQDVRRNGRLFKRLIDEGRDVSAVASKLLNDDFDLRAWMQHEPPLAPHPTVSGSNKTNAPHRRTSAFARPPTSPAPRRSP